MKLRNKKTGEIVSCLNIAIGIGKDGKWYGSLAELNEEWENYEEPKHWYIDFDGVVIADNLDESFIQKVMKIGNYFDTQEEAELVVKKLKEWKRLKDKGFRFNRWTIPEEPKTPYIRLVIEAEMDVPDSPYDLDLLFGGEE